MYRNGISLLPGAIDPNLSRGHPLFFHAMAAAWMHIFGTSNKSLHLFALFISLLFLITIYEVGYRIFNKRVAVIALLLVATHVSFFVQSSFVLFEVLVAFLCFLSIYLYVKEKYLLTTLTLTALFLTKESGIIAGFVIGADAIIGLFSKNILLKTKLLKLMPVVVACSTMGLFFVIQKHVSGWYVLPLYTDTILSKWPDIWYRFRTCIVKTIFYEGYDYLVFFALYAYSIMNVLKERKLKSLALLVMLVPGILVYWFIDDGRSEIFNAANITLVAFFTFTGFYILSLYVFSASVYYETSIQRKLILLLGFFALCFMLFSSVAYFIPRYLLACSIPVLFLLAVFLDMLMRHSWSMLYYPLLAVIAVSAFWSFKESNGWGDTDMGFYYGLKTQVGIVEFMERNNFYDKNIAASYLNDEHLKDKNTGFLTSDRNFKNVGYSINPNTELVIFDNIEPDKRRDTIAKNTSYELIYKFSIRDVWSEIYRRK